MKETHYVIPITEIRQVKETMNPDEVQELIEKGWELLRIVPSEKGTLYGLGTNPQFCFLEGQAPTE